MTAHLLALASAILYGSGDFLGGLATRRAPALLVVAIGQAAGLAVLVLMHLLSAPAPMAPDDLLWGALAGVSGGGGVATLYRALAAGSMSVVAPTTAVCAVAVPVLWDFATGARPGAQATAGIGLAVVAILLISYHAPSPGGVRSGRRFPPGFGIAFLSGLLIGGFFLALANTSPAAGWWPLLSARATSVSCFAVAMLAGRRSWRAPAPAMGLIVGSGVLDMLANAVYLLAMRGGPLASVVTLASLYPASTVLLARAVLGERVNRVQGAGVLLALAAVAVIVTSAVS